MADEKRFRLGMAAGGLVLAGLTVLGADIIIKDAKESPFQPENGIFRTQKEQEQRELENEFLENTIDGFGMDYKSFINSTGFRRDLPAEYDNWKVSVDVNDDFIKHGRQAAVNYSEDGLGKVVQINLSQRDADKIIEKYRTGGK